MTGCPVCGESGVRACVDFGSHMTTAHRATYRGVGPYKGVVKNAKGEIVAECEHWHRNRDQGTYFSGGSARACGKRLLREIDPESYEASLPAYLRAKR